MYVCVCLCKYNVQYHSRYASIATYGPLTLVQHVMQFYKPICASNNAMDIDSDSEDEGTINVYED